MTVAREAPERPSELRSCATSTTSKAWHLSPPPGAVTRPGNLHCLRLALYPWVYRECHSSKVCRRCGAMVLASTRVKIIEAAARAQTTVPTRPGAEGLDFEDGRDDKSRRVRGADPSWCLDCGLRRPCWLRRSFGPRSWSVSDGQMEVEVATDVAGTHNIGSRSLASRTKLP